MHATDAEPFVEQECVCVWISGASLALVFAAELLLLP